MGMKMVNKAMDRGWGDTVNDRSDATSLNGKLNRGRDKSPHIRIPDTLYDLITAGQLNRPPQQYVME